MNNLLFTTVDVSTGRVTVPKLNVGLIFSAILLTTLVYLAALQWNSAFTLSIQNLQNRHQELNEEEASYVVAASVTVFLLLITVLIYFIMRHSLKRMNKSVPRSTASELS